MVIKLLLTIQELQNICKQGNFSVISNQYITTVMSYFNFLNFDNDVQQILFIFNNEKTNKMYSLYFIMKKIKKLNEYFNNSNIMMFTDFLFNENTILQIQVNEFSVDNIIKYLYLDLNNYYDEQKFYDIDNKFQNLNDNNIYNRKFLFDNVLKNKEIGYLDLTYLIGVYNYEQMNNIFFTNQHKIYNLKNIIELLQEIINSNLIYIKMNNLKGQIIYYSVLLNKIDMFIQIFPTLLLSNLLFSGNYLDQEKKFYVGQISEMSYLLNNIKDKQTMYVNMLKNENLQNLQQFEYI